MTPLKKLLAPAKPSKLRPLIGLISNCATRASDLYGQFTIEVQLTYGIIVSDYYVIPPVGLYVELRDTFSRLSARGELQSACLRNEPPLYTAIEQNQGEITVVSPTYQEAHFDPLHIPRNYCGVEP